MTASLETAIQHAGNTVVISIADELDAAAEPALRRAPEALAPEATAALTDVHRVPFMDSACPVLLLGLLGLHGALERGGLRVLVVGRQPQPQRLVRLLAGLPADGEQPYAAQRGALAALRRMIEERAAHRQRQAADRTNGPR
ncbi:STAS domain-containing protein [Streptomyces sp. NPDC060048]|uniref:STAS domain-containing protein n=1 Tax=unclassified Streptomyces TaxID=2593676 RepID=UPI003698958F